MRELHWLEKLTCGFIIFGVIVAFIRFVIEVLL